MIDRATKLRWRRMMRHRKRQVEDISSYAEENLEQHFFKRLNKMASVRRFVLSWILLMILLSGVVVLQIGALSSYYLAVKPVPGSTYTEGILGAFTNANPLYASSVADSAVSRLLFAGLMKYDSDNKLVPDLAESLTVDATGRNYTVVLKSGLTWHDGNQLTAKDVVFTYDTIKNPDAKSPLRMSWQDVTVEARDERTIVFTLPNALSAFPNSLTNGIVPEHHLKSYDPVQLRSVRFNSASPVGAGPFKWETIEVNGEGPEGRQEQIGLVPFENYHAGEPKLQRFIVRIFRNEQQLIKSFQDHDLDAIAGLEVMPDVLKEEKRTHEYNIPLTSQVMVFFKTTQEPFTDGKVRQALVQSVNIAEIIKDLGFPVVVSRSPFLSSHAGYAKDLEQLPFDKARASQLLDEAGWVLKDGIRQKDGKPLAFRLYSQSTLEYTLVSQKLQQYWSEIGVDVQVSLQTGNDLQSTVAQHTYDALLYGISLGVDPDVFAYWHSTQANPNSGAWLNLSEYKSTAADGALEGGRTREDPALRGVKYRPFLQAWRSDAPALALYQPRFFYLTRGILYNFEPTVINAPQDRYANVHEWMVKEGKAPKLAQ